MRTNIEIDDKLMAQAMRGLGTKTKHDTVEEALKMAIQIRGQRGILKLRGKVKWEGDLNEMRRDRFQD